MRSWGARDRVYLRGQHALDHGRYSIAWSGVGLAYAALNAMVAYSKRREQFGSKLSKFQLIREKIADAVTHVYAARSLCLRAAQTRRTGSPEAVTESLIAKQFAAGVAFAWPATLSRFTAATAAATSIPSSATCARRRSWRSSREPRRSSRW